MKENTIKDKLTENELEQVNGGGWIESCQDRGDAEQFKKYGITVTKKPWFDDNMYSYKGKEYNRIDLFKQLRKDGLRKEVPCLYSEGMADRMGTTEFWV